MTDSRDLYVMLEGVTSLPRSIILNGEESGICVMNENSIKISFPKVKASEVNLIEVVL